VPTPWVPQEKNAALEQASNAVHVVQFYEPEMFPARDVAEYFCTGLQLDEASFLIATPDHTSLVKDCLETRGVDTEAAEGCGMLICKDASATKKVFLEKYSIDPTGLLAKMGSALAEGMETSPTGRVRVFGEVVNLLVGEGEFETCLQIEREWNRLLEKHTFRLYCAYSTAEFSEESSAAYLSEICDLHDRVVTSGTTEGPQSWLGVLQEGCRALQAEREKRREEERAWQAWETSYAELLEEHVLRWTESCRPEAMESPQMGRTHLAAGARKLDVTIEKALRGILAACEESCAERRGAVPGSAEWHKRSGEILAYGKLTHVLHELQKCRGAAARK
jgi:hypothetical protein